MDVEAAYLEAAIPTPITLLHQQLEPYSLGHEMLLAKLRSPFVSPVIDPTFEDLKLGVLICSNNFEEAQAQLKAPDLGEKIFQWNRIIGTIDVTTLPTLIAEFELYRIEGMRCPRFNRVNRGRGGRVPGAPFLSLLFYTLTRELHFTKTEALNTPYGWAQWLYCCHHERLGNLVILSSDEQNAEETIRAAFRERGMEWMRADPASGRVL